MTQYDGMQMSCQCFAKMLIHFRFVKFLALRIGHIFRKGHAEILFDIDGSNSLSYLVQAIMIIMSGRVVTKYLESAMEDMLRNKQKEIRCPCRKCNKKVLPGPLL
jgi:hypothetical protein